MTRVWAAICVTGSIAAYFYSQYKGIPARIAIPAAIAFLLELCLYSTLGRDLLRRPWQLAASAVAPYLIYSAATGTFTLRGFAILAALALAITHWFRVLDRRWDPLFVALWGVPYLTKLVHAPYLLAFEGLRIDALGQLMWFRLGVTAILRERPSDHHAFGFVPAQEHWITGLKFFAYSVPVALALNWLIAFANWRLAEGYWWKAPLTFLGIIWVVALAEEVLFRGLLQEFLTARVGAVAAVAATSLVFGCGHLWFANKFPNWKHALMAGSLSVFWGWAYLAGRSVRASMVTHALTVTAWRTFFS